MRKQRWRFFGMLVFSFFAFMELGSLLALLSSGRRGTPVLDSYFLVIQAIVSSFIILFSLATAYALFSGAAWTRYSALTTTVLLVIYGVYQFLGGFIQTRNPQITALMTGIMYILLGLAANWIDQMARSSPRQSK